MGLKHVEHAPLGPDKVFFYRSRKKKRKPCSWPISQIWFHLPSLVSQNGQASFLPHMEKKE